MASPGLSLVGFMEQQHAVAHLKLDCRPKNPADAALIAEWQAAKLKLGTPFPTAGKPDIQPLPPAAQAHVTQLIVQSGGQLPPGLSFQWVEIEPLLAFQFTVDKAHSSNRCNTLSKPPTVQELMDLALPLTVTPENFDTYLGERSVLLKARSLNVRPGLAGHLKVPVPGGVAQILGMQPDTSAPHVHVVRFNGRCYLHNGFHRSTWARLAGATHVPCLFRDVMSPAEVGIKDSTFGLPLLESGNPPTLGHFTQNRSWDVELREFWRFISVSWSEYAIPID